MIFQIIFFNIIIFSFVYFVCKKFQILQDKVELFNHKKFVDVKKEKYVVGGISIFLALILLENTNLVSDICPDIYIVNLGNGSRDESFKIGEYLRDHNYKVAVNLDSASFKSQMKKADKSNAKIALIIGEDELENNLIQVKLMRKDGSQAEFKQKELLDFIKNHI